MSSRPAGGRRRGPAASSTYGIVVDGTTDPDVLVRMAKCCTPVPGDEVIGYISLGRGITIHRDDCPNVRALKRTPERFTAGELGRSRRGDQLVPRHDRAPVLGSPAPARGRRPHVRRARRNIVEYGGHVADQMARNWYTVEVGDVKELRALLSALRNIDAVFDAYRVTPGG